LYNWKRQVLCNFFKKIKNIIKKSGSAGGPAGQGVCGAGRASPCCAGLMRAGPKRAGPTRIATLMCGDDHVTCYMGADVDAGGQTETYRRRGDRWEFYWFIFCHDI